MSKRRGGCRMVRTDSARHGHTASSIAPGRPALIHLVGSRDATEHGHLVCLELVVRAHHFV